MTSEAVGLEVLDRLAANDLAGARVLLDWLREDWHLAGGDDPLRALLFAGLDEGKRCGCGDHEAGRRLDSDEIQTDGSRRGWPSWSQPKIRLATTRIRLISLLAVLDGYRVCLHMTKPSPFAAHLAKQYPGVRVGISQPIYSTCDRSADSTKRDGLAAERVKRIPGDFAAMRVLVYNAMTRETMIRRMLLRRNYRTRERPRLRILT